MAEFGAPSTGSYDVPNAVTPKEGVVNQAGATLAGALGGAALQGADIYQKNEKRKDLEGFRKTEEDLFLIGTGLDTIDPYAPEKESFRKYMERVAQVQKMGSVSGARYKMKEELRKRIAENPRLAQDYLQIVNEVLYDYSEEIDLLDDAAAQGSAGEKERRKLVSDTETKLATYGVNEQKIGLSPGWQQQATEEELFSARSLLNAEIAATAASRLRREDDAEQRSIRSEQRAERGLSIQEQQLRESQDARRRANGSDAHRDLIETSYSMLVQNAVMRAQQASGDPVEVLREYERAIPMLIQSGERSLRYDNDGNPTNLEDQDLKDGQAFIANSVEYWRTMLQNQVNFPEQNLKYTQSTLGLNLAKQMPTFAAIAEIFPAATSSPVFTNALQLAMTTKDSSLMQRASEEAKRFGAGQTREERAKQLGVPALEAAVHGTLPPVGTEGFAAGLAVGYAREGYRAGTPSARSFDQNPGSFGNMVKTFSNEAAPVDRPSTLNYNDRKDMWETILAPEFVGRFERTPVMEQRPAASAALNLLRVAQKEDPRFRGAPQPVLIERYQLLYKALGKDASPENILKEEYGIAPDDGQD